MNKKLIALAVAGVLTIPAAANAVEVAGEKLEVYGKLHMSVDSSDRDISTVSNDGISISSNSSRLGFKGKLPTESGFDVIWQIEQEVRLDDAGSSDFANRNSFVGLASGAHSFRVGIHDTPFKGIASKWGIFGDSVGERRSILGAGYANGNQLNERVKNALMYQFKNKDLKVQAMYAVEPEGASGGVDDNDKKMAGLGMWYKMGGLKLSAGWEDWTQHSHMADGSAYRLAATYKMGRHQLGALYENIDSDTVAEFKRAAYGVNWKWKFAGKTDLRLQYLVADEADGTTDTGATKIGLGIFHSLDKHAKVYVAYGATDNDANASFQAVDGGHGDEVKTENGGSPSSLSVGLIYKF